MAEAQAKPAPAQSERDGRRVEVGVVVSDRMNKTRTVAIERFVRHPKYGKFMKRATHCKVHDEKNESKAGDRVEIMETRPLSRTKRWRLMRIMARGLAQEPVKGAEPA